MLVPYAFAAWHLPELPLERMRAKANGGAGDEGSEHDGHTSICAAYAVSAMFERFSPSDVEALLADYPLAWMSAGGRSGADTALLPLIGEFDNSGALVELVGHMGRATPLRRALAANTRALVLFQGPQGYVSPEHAGRLDWAPTWNFAQMRIEVEVTFVPDETDVAIDRLVTQMEDGRPAPWHPREMGERYGQMAEAIIGFRARTMGQWGRFKLGQDENEDTLRTIVARHPDPQMVRWMRRMNPGRV